MLGEGCPQPVGLAGSSRSPQPVGASVGLPQAAVPLSTHELEGAPLLPQAAIADKRHLNENSDRSLYKATIKDSSTLSQL